MKYAVRVVKLDSETTKNKNKALKEMLQSGEDFLFLVEENCKVLDPKIYDIFVATSHKTGIEALMWGRGSINKRLEFNDDPYIDYFTDFVSSFMLFTRNAVQKVGLFDEEMPSNTWQELEYAKRIGDAGLSTPFGMFASPKNVDQYFSITTPKNEFKNLDKMEEGLKYWEDKSDEFPINIRNLNKPKFEMI